MMLMCIMMLILCIMMHISMGSAVVNVHCSLAQKRISGDRSNLFRRVSGSRVEGMAKPAGTCLQRGSTCCYLAVRLTLSDSTRNQRQQIKQKIT